MKSVGLFTMPKASPKQTVGLLSPPKAKPKQNKLKVDTIKATTKPAHPPPMPVPQPLPFDRSFRILIKLRLNRMEANIDCLDRIVKEVFNAVHQ